VDTVKTLPLFLKWVQIAALAILSLLAALATLYYLIQPGEDAWYAVGMFALLASGLGLGAQETYQKLKEQHLNADGTQVGLVLIATLAALFLHGIFHPPFTFEDILKWSSQE
jgi:hypothetical protein